MNHFAGDGGRTSTSTSTSTSKTAATDGTFQFKRAVGHSLSKTKQWLARVVLVRASWCFGEIKIMKIDFGEVVCPSKSKPE
jgi:hypothetical protein